MWTPHRPQESRKVFIDRFLPLGFSRVHSSSPPTWSTGKRWQHRKGTRNHLLFIRLQPSTAAGPARPAAQTRSFQKLINKHLKVSFTFERAHALCAHDTRTDCVICFCPSDPAAELRRISGFWLLQNSFLGMSLTPEMCDNRTWRRRPVEEACQLSCRLHHVLHDREAAASDTSQERAPGLRISPWFTPGLPVIGSARLNELNVCRLIMQPVAGAEQRRRLQPPCRFRQVKELWTV